RGPSGCRPTEPMHIGHLVGALDNWIKMQDTHECFFAICDWHALTSEYADTSRIRDYVEDMALDWLAAGLDPDKSTIFVQSHVPEQAECHLLLSMIVPGARRERVPPATESQRRIAEPGPPHHGGQG